MPTAPETLEAGKNMAAIKNLNDGVYTPGDKNFDSAGDGSDVTGSAGDNVIFKFTATQANKATVLKITNSSGQTVYTETSAGYALNQTGNGHFFYLYRWCDGQNDLSAWDNVQKPDNGTVGTKGTHGMTPGATYSYTITEDGTVIAQGSFVA